jgi:hypothetical protein
MLALGYWHPDATDIVPPRHVTVAEPATVQAPLQVIVQVPDAQITFEPGPTRCVHDVPEHVTLQLLPHEPVHVEPAPQA